MKYFTVARLFRLLWLIQKYLEIFHQFENVFKVSEIELAFNVEKKLN